MRKPQPRVVCFRKEMKEYEEIILFTEAGPVSIRSSVCSDSSDILAVSDWKRRTVKLPGCSEKRVGWTGELSEIIIR